MPYIYKYLFILEFMGNKEKGSNAERELLKMFSGNSWRAVRVASNLELEEFTAKKESENFAMSSMFGL